ncbi:CBS domain-containing protein [Pseudarcicella hirudinis]|uniref:CBS domain-containing protein n=3 Tax=Pseudarcicella hirudinis TaxID=1079859 RepID=A0A1I5YW45_9BACT|nr:CBS domain-containing protein [Pseudarcicella hirudinis]SFQ48225.1 CBS domain-containing protein [Pseudarcicella hirudinis]
MIAEELLNPMLPVLKPTDTIGQALDWMDEYRVNHLVLTNGLEYRGLISHDVLLDNNEELPLLALQPMFEEVFTYPHQHLLEVLPLLQQYELDVIAVLDENNGFIGTILNKDVLNTFAKSLGTSEAGAILEVEVDDRSYSLSEISRLIESNDTKVISSYYSGGSEDNDFRNILTLKLNRKDITRVVATLERFGYDVKSAFAHSPVDSPDKERYDLLMKYLDI